MSRTSNSSAPLRAVGWRSAGHEARQECAALGAGLQIEGRTARVIHCRDQSVSADGCA